MVIESCNEKMIQIIGASSMEFMLKKTLREVGVNGFTFFNVRGDGDSGFQSGQFESDSNVMFIIVLSSSKRDLLLDKLKVLLKRGHHLTIFSLDTEVFSPSKFD